MKERPVRRKILTLTNTDKVMLTLDLYCFADDDLQDDVTAMIEMARRYDRTFD